jgi:hypothetical protein
MAAKGFCPKPLFLEDHAQAINAPRKGRKKAI